MPISIDSGIEQDSRVGYNLVDVFLQLVSSNGLTAKQNDDKSIVINGTATGNYSIFVDINITDILEDGETYTFTSNNNTGELKYIYSQIAMRGIDGTIGYLSVTNKCKTFKVDKSKHNRYMFQVQTGIVTGMTFNNYVEQVMLLKGSYTADTLPPYEQYGAMPSLSFPSEVKGVGNEEEINILENKLTTKTNGGVTFTKNKDGSVSYDGISTGSYSLCYADLSMENIFEEVYACAKEYGNECMFKKAVSEKELKRRKIKTYKQFIEEKRYTLKFIEHYEGIMTLHHLKHVEEGRRNNKRKWGNS
jgi:hypothetical protein